MVSSHHGDEVRPTKASLRKLLNSSYSTEGVRFDWSTYRRHLTVFTRYFESTGDADFFEGYAVVLDSAEHLRSPDECCLWGFQKSLGQRFAAYEARKYSVNPDYNCTEDVWAFMAAIGVLREFPIVQIGTQLNPEVNFMKSRGVRHSSYRLDCDYWIPNLEEIVKDITVPYSEMIWDTMRRADPEVFRACYRMNQSNLASQGPSRLIQFLRDAEWIVARDGVARRPSEIAWSQLGDGFSLRGCMEWMREVRFAESASTPKGELAGE